MKYWGGGVVLEAGIHRNSHPLGATGIAVLLRRYCTGPCGAKMAPNANMAATIAAMLTGLKSTPVALARNRVRVRTGWSRDA